MKLMPATLTQVIEVAGFRDTWRPAAGEIEAVGEQPVSSAEAVGLVDFTSRRSAKERAAILQGILMPPADQVEAKVAEVLTQLLGEQDARGAIQMVQARGWEAAVTVYTERGRQAKREWTRVTHRTYGSKIADDWRPDGWVADLDRLSEIEAQAAVTAARDALAALHQVRAISEDRRQAALEARDALPDAKDKLKAAPSGGPGAGTAAATCHKTHDNRAVTGRSTPCNARCRRFRGSTRPHSTAPNVRRRW